MGCHGGLKSHHSCTLCAVCGCHGEVIRGLRSPVMRQARDSGGNRRECRNGTTVFPRNSGCDWQGRVQLRLRFPISRHRHHRGMDSNPSLSSLSSPSTLSSLSTLLRPVLRCFQHSRVCGQAVYVTLREAEVRSTSLLPLWKVPLLRQLLPRQREVDRALVVINEALDQLVERCKVRLRGRGRGGGERVGIRERLSLRGGGGRLWCRVGWRRRRLHSRRSM